MLKKRYISNFLGIIYCPRFRSLLGLQPVPMDFCQDICSVCGRIRFGPKALDKHAIIPPVLFVSQTKSIAGTTTKHISWNLVFLSIMRAGDQATAKTREWVVYFQKQLSHIRGHITCNIWIYTLESQMFLLFDIHNIHLTFR